MNGIVFNTKSYAVHDGPGIRTTVFLKGCPLRCWWCHNPESFRKSPEQVLKKIHQNNTCFTSTKDVGQHISAHQLLDKLEREILFFEESGGGVTFSGGEPFVQWKFLLQAAKLCKENDIHVAVDTTGHVQNSILLQVAPYINLFLFDLKHMNSQKHKQYTGVDNQKILENFDTLLQLNKQVIARIPVIPKLNYTEENLLELENFLRPRVSKIHEIHLLPYHNMANAKYENHQIENKMHNTPPLHKDDLIPLQKRLQQLGATVRIGG